MTFDFIGTRFGRLVMFCRQAVRIQQTPDLISFVAGDTDYVGFCRIITNSDDKFKKRFTAMCCANRMDPDGIRRRMKLVASVLGIYKQVDYYRILGVTPNADMQIIKKAYRKKAQILHPDKAAGDVENSEAFIKLHDAYVHLSDPMVRQLYDQSRDGSSDWVEGKKSSQMPAWGVGFGRFLSWMIVFIGSVIIVSYAFDIYNNGSIAFFFKQLLTDQMDEPELISKQQFNRGPRAVAMEMVTNKIQNTISVPAFETESETVAELEFKAKVNNEKRTDVVSSFAKAKCAAFPKKNKTKSDKPAAPADKGQPIKKHVFAKEQLHQKLEYLGKAKRVRCR